MTCAGRHCDHEATKQLFFNGKNRDLCECCYELAKMILVMLDLRQSTGTNPSFEAVSTAMDKPETVN